MKVSVLGTVYTIKTVQKEKNNILKTENIDGYTDFINKTIVLADFNLIEDWKKETKKTRLMYRKNVLRHELTHAMLFESGLDVCASPNGAWARNEEVVDWIAIQGEKLYELWKSAGALHSEG